MIYVVSAGINITKNVVHKKFFKDLQFNKEICHLSSDLFLNFKSNVKKEDCVVYFGEYRKQWPVQVLRELEDFCRQAWVDQFFIDHL